MWGGIGLKIGVLLGDDIGLEVVPECIKVMKAAAAREGLLIEWRPLPIGKRGHEAHGHTLPAVTEQGLRELDGWVMGPIGHAAYPRGDATCAQEVRSVRGGATGALPCHNSLRPQGCGHRVSARAHGGNALFRDGRCRPA